MKTPTSQVISRTYGTVISDNGEHMGRLSLVLLPLAEHKRPAYIYFAKNEGRILWLTRASNPPRVEIRHAH